MVMAVVTRMEAVMAAVLVGMMAGFSLRRTPTLARSSVHAKPIASSSGR